MENQLRKLKSGVYFVSFDKMQTFIDHAADSGWKPTLFHFIGRFESAKKNNTYIAISLDKDHKRVGHWGCGHTEDEVDEWDDWDFTDHYIEIYDNYDMSDILY